MTRTASDAARLRKLADWYDQQHLILLDKAREAVNTALALRTEAEKMEKMDE